MDVLVMLEDRPEHSTVLAHVNSVPSPETENGTAAPSQVSAAGSVFGPTGRTILVVGAVIDRLNQRIVSALSFVSQAASPTSVTMQGRPHSIASDQGSPVCGATWPAWCSSWAWARLRD